MSEQNGKPRIVLHEVEQEVSLVGRDGQEHDYVVGELDDDGLAQYLESLDRRMTVENGKVTGQDYKGMHAELISLTVREKATGRRVGLDEAKGWGPHAKATLFNMAQDINGLSTRVREREKKESPPTETSGVGSESQTDKASEG